MNYIIFGEDSYITVHDVLDDILPNFQMVINQGAYFDPDAIMPVGIGLKRSLFFNPTDLTALWYVFLPSYWATVVQIFMCKLTAFVGMYFFIKYSYDCKEDYRLYVPLITAIAFSMIPSYYIYGIGTAGTPMVALAFLFLYRNQHVLFSHFLLIVYAFYSYLPLVGFFVCFTVAALIVYLLVRDKRLPIQMFIGLCLISAVYLVANWSMIKGFFIPGGEPYHRVEFHFEPIGLLSAIKQSLTILAFSQYHAGTFFALPIILLMLYACYKNNCKDEILNLHIFSIVGIGVISVLYNYLKSDISFFSSFQFDRFYFLLPFTIMSSLGYLLVNNKRKTMKIILLSVLSLVCISSFAKDEEHKDAVKRIIDPSCERISYKQFYDEALFGEIKNDMVQDKEVKACALGFHPNILMYNNIPSVDFYHNLYSLEYKHKFRSIIEKELEKSKELKYYFDNWGNRCYVFSSELGRHFLYGKNDTVREINKLEISTNKLKDLGCQYIISAVRINNADDLGIKYIKTYSSPESFWELYLYELIDKE